MLGMSMTEHLVYKKLAIVEKSPENRAALERLSEQERTHYESEKPYAERGRGHKDPPTMVRSLGNIIPEDDLWGHLHDKIS